MKTLSSTIFVAAVLAILCMAGNAQAVTVPLDIAGVSSPVAVLDLSPGNAIAVGGNLNPATNVSFPLFYQAKLGNYLDTDGNAILGSGLNTSYELTVVFGFYETGTLTGTNSNGGNSGTNASFAFDPSKPSFVYMFKDPLRDSSNLNGTGFTNGALVLSGHVIPDNFDSSFQSTNNLVSVNPYANLDSSPNGNQWGTQKSVNGSGGTDITVAVDSFDTSFFTGLDPSTLLLFDIFANTSNNLPFNQVDPSKQFYDGFTNTFITSTATLGAVNGAANGQGGQNVMFQADANASFIVETSGVPEPSTFAMCGLGLLIAGVFMRRRRV